MPHAPQPLVVLGVTFDGAPAELRRRLALDPHALGAVGGALAARGAEAAVVATCHRTEVVLAGLDLGGALEAWHGALVAGGSPACLAPAATPFVHTGLAAHRHLLRLACGLESPLLGDRDVLGQLRDAHRRAHEAGTLGPVLRRAFRTAFATAKRARATTGIAAGGAGIGAAVADAVAAAGQDGPVLLVGSGMAARSIARQLGRRRCPLTVASRTPANAAALASATGARCLPLAAVPGALADHEAVVVAVTAPEPVLRADVLAAAERAAPGWRPLLVDVGAVPTIEAPPGLPVLDLAQLAARRDAGQQARREAVPLVETLIERALQRALLEEVAA